MEERVSNHPCHRLSIPSAKLFWCRHCMQSFEDPINRWRHSKTCKTIGPSNHDRRLEQEPFALQTYIETKQKEVANQPQLVEGIGGEHVVIIKQEKPEPKSEYSCFICKRPFESLEDMKEHVKYPCSRNQNSDYPIYIPGSGGTYVENVDMFPNSSRPQQSQAPAPQAAREVIQRQIVEGEIVEQSADPETGVRTFEVHSQNDDVPLSDILSRLSESGYLVAGDTASSVNQVIVVQQVDEKGQITQSEHILPPHIQIQNTDSLKQTSDGSVETIIQPVMEAQDDHSPTEEITYYVTDAGELIEPAYVQVKQEPRQDSYYGSYDSQSGMNILTQAAEATIGNLINQQEKRKAEEEEEESNVKRSRNQCRPEEDKPNPQPPHSPHSPRGAGGSSWTGGSTGAASNVVTTVIKTEQSSNQGSSNGEQGKQQTLEPVNDENNPKSNSGAKSKSKKSTEKKKRCTRPEPYNYYKCRICDKTFKTIQLLNRHSQFPCKVFNTRNMSQKILRPNRGNASTTGRNNVTNRRLQGKNVSQFKNIKHESKIFRKSILLLDGLKVGSHLLDEKRMKQRSGRRKEKEPAYDPTPSRIKTIWLPSKPPLVVEELPYMEQFLFEVGLVSTNHFHPKSLPRIPHLFSPLTISTEMDSLKMAECSDDVYFLPPVLERMDDIRCLDDGELSDEPPILSPILDVEESRGLGKHSRSNIQNSHKNKPTFTEIKNISKSKLPEQVRHFTDLFVKASPATGALSPVTNSDDLELELSDKTDECTDTKPKNDLFTKRAAISKLADELKKKLMPQKKECENSTNSDSVQRKDPEVIQLCVSSLVELCKKSLSLSGGQQNSSVDKHDLHLAQSNNPTSVTDLDLDLSNKTSEMSSPSSATKTLVLPIIKTDPLKSPTKINIVIYRKRSAASSPISPACASEMSRESNKEIEAKVNGSLESMNFDSGVCEAVQSRLDAMIKVISQTSEEISEEAATIDCIESNRPSEHAKNERSEERSSSEEQVTTRTTSQTNVPSSSGKEELESLESEISCNQDDGSSLLPGSVHQVAVKEEAGKQPSEDSLATLTLIGPSPQEDEGIVEDITNTKLTNGMWDDSLMQKISMERSPKVMVQYMERVDVAPALMTDKLSYVVLDGLDNRDHSNSSQDYLVRKISLCEEEIVLSDSGLDDSDEILSNNCLETTDPIIQTIQC